MVARFTALIFLSLVMSAPALALRCGSDLVLKGDSQSRVLKKCGEPEARYNRVVVRSGGIGVVGEDRSQVQQIGFDKVAVEIQVAEWDYSFGPRRFGRRIIFESGRVVKIELMGYDD